MQCDWLISLSDQKVEPREKTLRLVVRERELTSKTTAVKCVLCHKLLCPYFLVVPAAEKKKNSWVIIKLTASMTKTITTPD